MSENITDSQTKHELKDNEQKLTVSPTNSMIETEEQPEQEDEPKNCENVPESDALLLIEAIKKRFEMISEKSKEIARTDGRTIVTHDDAEHAIRLIRDEDARKKIEEHVMYEEEDLEICPYCGMPIPEDEFERYGSCYLCVLEEEQTREG